MSACAGQLLNAWPQLAVPSSVAGTQPLRLVADSRQLKAGDAFVALPGLTHDGRKYIADAISAGVSLVMAEADDLSLQWLHDTPVFHLPKLTALLSQVAACFYGFPAENLHVFAVTGTNGKTTCSHLYAQLRRGMGKPCGVIGTLGGGLLGSELIDTGMTTPDAITTQMLLAEISSQGAEFVAMEASSHSLDQNRLSAVPVHTALYTNLSRDHLDYHGNMENYAASKWKIFVQPELAVAVINHDDVQGAKWLENYQGAGKLYSYSTFNNAADVYVSNTQYSAAGVSAVLHSPWGESELNSPLIGSFNLSNLLGVTTALLAEGVALSALATHITALTPVTGRMQRLPAVTGVAQVVVDYAHTPDGLQQALSALRRHCSGELWCVFGCGGDRDSGKRPEMGRIAETLADHCIVTNDNPRTENPLQIASQILAGMDKPQRALVELNRKAAIHQAILQAGPKDLVLVAGKGHEDYQIIGNQRLDFSDLEVCSNAMASNRKQ